MDRMDTLLACCMLMLTVGAMYSFSAFSGRLGEEMNFDATELNLIGTAYNLGTWFGVVGGLVCDRLGPIRTIRYGALICNMGTVGSALACIGFLPQGSGVFALLAFTFSQGTGWAYLSGMKQGLQVFHTADHSSIVGTLACFVALSAGVLSQLYKCALAPLPLPIFYILLGSTCAALQLGSTHFFGEPFDGNRHTAPLLNIEEGGRLRHVMVLAVCLILWIMVMSLVESHTDVAQGGMLLMWCVLMGLVCAIPLLSLWWRRVGHPIIVADDEAGGSAYDLRRVDGAAAQAESAEETPDEGGVLSPAGEEAGDPVVPQPSGFAFLLLCAATLDFWLLVVAITSALAFPVTLLNNLTPFVQSIRPLDALDEITTRHFERVIGACVALFSVGNSLGRLSSGYLAHRYSPKGVPRWSWFLIACGLHLLANAALIVWWDVTSLYWVIFCTGFGLGVTFTIAPIATSDMFREANFATMWGALTISPCISTELLGTLLAGHVADAARVNSNVVVNGHTYCHGARCFQTTFVVTAAVECVGLVSACGLLHRLRQALQ